MPALGPGISQGAISTTLLLVEGDTILEKTAEGNLDVYDPKMKPIPNYKMNAKKFNEAMERLNAFFKH